MDRENLFIVCSERLKTILGITTDTDLARTLGMSRTALNNRKKVGSIPFDAVLKLCMEKGISLDEIFGSSGDGKPLSPAEAELAATYRGMSKKDREALLAHARGLMKLREE